MRHAHRWSAKRAGISFAVVALAAGSLGAVRADEPLNVVPVAGSPVFGPGASTNIGDDGPALDAVFANAVNLVVDPGTGDLYVGDREGNRIRRIDAATRTITTIAGNGISTGQIDGVGPTGDQRDERGDGGLASGATVAFPNALMIRDEPSPDGTTHRILYFGESTDVRRIDLATQIISTVATNPKSLPFGGGLAFDAAGNLYVSDLIAERIWKVAPGGAVSVLAGTGVAGYNGDTDPATGHPRASEAQLNQPFYLAVAKKSDLSGELLFVGELANDRIRVIDLAASPPTIATYLGPLADSVWAFAAEYNPDGTLQDFFVATTGGLLQFPDPASPTGPPKNVAPGRFTGFCGIALDPSTGDLFISSDFDGTISKRDASGTITHYAGRGHGVPGPATAALIDIPIGVLFDAQGDLLVSDDQSLTVRKIDPAGMIANFAGSGVLSPFPEGGTAPDDGVEETTGQPGEPEDDSQPAGAAALGAPSGMAFDPSTGDVYIGYRAFRFFADYTLQRVDPSGQITPFGPVLHDTRGIARDNEGYTFVAEQSPNNDVRRIGPDGTDLGLLLGRTSAAAHAITGFSPVGLAFDVDGALFVVDPGTRRIYKVAPAPVSGGILTGAAGETIATVFGSGVAALAGGSVGDGAPAVLAAANQPTWCAFELDGSLLFTEGNGRRLRKIAAGADGRIRGGFAADPATGKPVPAHPEEVASTVAGGPNLPLYNDLAPAYGTAGLGGPATAAQFQYVSGVAVDAAGNIALVDRDGFRVLRLDVAAESVSVDLNVATVELASGRVAEEIDFSTVTLQAVDPVSGEPTSAPIPAVADGGVDPADARARTFGFGPQAALCAGTKLRLEGRFTDGRYFSGDAAPGSAEPTVSFGAPSPPANSFGWWNATDVQIPFTVSPLLAVASVSPAGPLHFTTDGLGLTQTVTVVDNCGGSVIAPSPLVNRDTTPPQVTASVSPSILWPPNHASVQVTVSVAVTDDLSGVDAATALASVVVTSNEPGDLPIVSPGPLTVATDGMSGTWSTTIELAATRLGSGSGRVYTVTVTARDKADNVGTGVATVTVPHDQGTAPPPHSCGRGDCDLSR
jgi:hypothetical protein